MRNLFFCSAIFVSLVACSSDSDKKKNSSNNEAYGAASKIAKAGDANSLSPSSFVPDRVFFDFDSDKLTSDAVDSVKIQAKFLKVASPAIIIEGHADERGTENYNLALGMKRAKAVKALLVKQGVKADKIKVVTYGKQRPEVSGSSEESYAKNRRSVIVIKALKK